MKLIDKDQITAEIERRKNLCEKISLDLRNQENKDYYQGKAEAYKETLDTLNALETKEVDFEEEVKRFTMSKELYETKSVIRTVAKHFFEFGLSVSNPITATDRGTAEEIIINLKRVEKDYHISLAKEIEWLRNKVKKGE